MGVRNMLGITGDVRSLGDIPDATAVFDVDSIGLTNVINRLNHGLDIGGQSIGAPTAFHAGVMVNPSRDLDQELRRLEFKVEAGAEFAVTRPVFDVAAFERFLKRVEPIRAADHRRHLAVRQRPERRVHGQRGAGRHRARRAGGADAARPTSAEAAAAEGVAIAREIADRPSRAMAAGRAHLHASQADWTRP